MESGAPSYCVYTPGNHRPSRPPLRRAAPEEARSGFPFLIAMAALVLAAAVGAVARFSPQDLRLEGGAKHPAATTTVSSATILDAKPADPAATAPSAPIPPTTFTTIGDPTAAPTTTSAHHEKPTHHPRSSGLPATRGSASAATSASAAPAIPDNPYSQPSPPEAYGF